MSLRRGLILNAVGLTVVVALTVSALAAIFAMKAEVSSLDNRICALGGGCAARAQSLIEGWLVLLSTVALALLATGTRMLYNIAVRLSRGGDRPPLAKKP